MENIYSLIEGLQYDADFGCIPAQCASNKEFNKELDKCVEKCSAGKIYDVKLEGCVDLCSKDETFKNGECVKNPCGIREYFDSFLDACIPCKPIGEIISASDVDLRQVSEACIPCKPVEELITASDVDLRQVSDECRVRKCSDYAHLGFKCVPAHICLNRTIVTDGKDLIDIRTDENSEITQCCAEIKGTLDVSDTKCDKINHVCCRNPDLTLKTCGVFSSCPDSKPMTDFNCGGVRTNFELRIIDSSDPSRQVFAQPGEFPHMCLIYRLVNREVVYLGGASLIDRNKVLTVAHKFLVGGGTKDVNIVNDRQIYVRCGEHDVKFENEFLEYQDIRVRQVNIHPDYNNKTLANDLAILETETNFIYQDHISPVCLPKPYESFDGSEDCISSGWGSGKVDDVAPYYPNVLRKVKLPVVSKSTCETQLNNVLKKRGKIIDIYPSWICVGGKDGNDTCTGDGGSPHVCNVNNRWVQVKIVNAHNSHSCHCIFLIFSLYSVCSDSNM